MVQAPARFWRPVSAVPSPVSLYHCHAFCANHRYSSVRDAPPPSVLRVVDGSESQPSTLTKGREVHTVRSGPARWAVSSAECERELLVPVRYPAAAARRQRTRRRRTSRTPALLHPLQPHRTRTSPTHRPPPLEDHTNSTPPSRPKLHARHQRNNPALIRMDLHRRLELMLIVPSVYGIALPREHAVAIRSRTVQQNLPTHRGKVGKAQTPWAHPPPARATT